MTVVLVFDEGVVRHFSGSVSADMKATTRDEKPLPNLPRRSIGDIAEAGASSDAIECMMFSEFFDPMIRVIAINLNN